MKQKSIFFLLGLMFPLFMQAQITGLSASVNPNVCNGGQSGAIDLVVQGSGNPLSYIWSNGYSTEDLDSLAAGWYMVTVDDNMGNLLVDSFEVTQPDPLVLSAQLVNVSTIGGNDGSITLSVLGGTSPYSFLWSGGQTEAQITALYGGNYDVVVSDANACALSESYFVDGPVPSGWNVTPTGVYDLVTLENNNCVSLDYTPLPLGSYIGVFYDDGGNDVCAGFTIWNGNSSSFFVYGQAPGTSNGMPSGSKYKWFVHSPVNGQDYRAYVCADSVYVNPEMLVGGTYLVHCLNAFSSFSQEKHFDAGWSSFALTLMPADPNVASVFGPYAPHIKVIKDEMGKAWWPEFGINSLGNLEITEGYWVKTLTPFLATIPGEMIFPSEYTVNIPLQPGYIGYFSLVPLPVTQVFQAISFPYNVFVSSDIGIIYWSFYGVGAFTMEPGEAYQIEQLSYPISIQLPANPCY